MLCRWRRQVLPKLGNNLPTRPQSRHRTVNTCRVKWVVAASYAEITVQISGRLSLLWFLLLPSGVSGKFWIFYIKKGNDYWFLFISHSTYIIFVHFYVENK
jgi:hypothetical protein